jgi:hypothetical protein
MGVGKYAKLSKALSQFYEKLLSDYELSFKNKLSADLDSDPHEFIISVGQRGKNGKWLDSSDYERIREIVRILGWQHSDVLTDHGFFPSLVLINGGGIYSNDIMEKSPVIRVLYDEWSNSERWDDHKLRKFSWE